MGPRLSAALMAGRAAAGLSRRLGRGGGTVIPGHLVPRIAPGALRDVTRSLPHGSIVVSGTNGKTTTTRLLSHILRGAGMRPIHNRAGANLLSGLFTAIAQGTDWQARPLGDVGLFEVDEATVPSALQHIQPRVLLLHNIFRDQLDRYGEVHFVARLWRESVAGLLPETTVLLNADDPLVAGLVGPGADGGHASGSSKPPSPRDFANVEARSVSSADSFAEDSANGELRGDSATGVKQRGPMVLSYGIDDPSVGTPSLPHAADARLCPRCGGALHYDLVFYGHLGHYHCSNCEFARPTPSV